MAQLVDCLTARGTAVLVIDMQGDFLDEGSPLAPLRGAELARSSAEFLEACRGMGVPVVHAIMEFRADGLDTPDNIGLLFEGLGRKLCVAGTDGTLPAPGCEPQAGEPVVKRQHYSAFWCSNLDVVLRSLHVSNLAMFGPLVDLGGARHLHRGDNARLQPDRAQGPVRRARLGRLRLRGPERRDHMEGDAQRPRRDERPGDGPRCLPPGDVQLMGQAARLLFSQSRGGSTPRYDICDMGKVKQGGFV